MDLFDYLSKNTPSLKNWSSSGVIGRGRYGVVYKIHKDMGHAYRRSSSALKIVEFDSLSLNVEANYINALNALKNEPHAVGTEDYFKIDIKKNQNDEIAHYLAVRMELLDPLPKTGLCEDEGLRLAAEMCDVLMTCHGMKPIIYHCDIKPDNILVAPDGSYKLGDFGEAQVQKKSGGTVFECGTEGYRAPELYSARNYDNRCDLYSLGMTLYVLLNNMQFPYGDAEATVKAQLRGKRLPSIPNVSKSFMHVIRKLCRKNPARRYESARELRAALEPIIVSRCKKIISEKKSETASDNMKEKSGDISMTAFEIVANPLSNELMSETVKRENLKDTMNETVVNLNHNDCYEKSENKKEEKTVVYGMKKRTLLDVYEDWRCSSKLFRSQYIPFHIKRMALCIFLAVVVTILLYTTFVRPNYTFVDGYFVLVTTDNLDFSNKGIDDIKSFARCTDLEILDLTGNDVSFEDIDFLKSEIPDCKVIWDIPIGSITIPSDSTQIDLSALGAEEIIFDKRFHYFTDLTNFNVCGYEVSSETFDFLQETLGRCEIIWDVPIGTIKVRSDADTIVLNDIGTENDIDLMANLKYFTKLSLLDMSGSENLSNQKLRALRDISTIESVIWEVNIEDATYKTNEPLCLSVSKINEDIIDNILCLEHIDLMDVSLCGLSNKENATLREEYPQFNIVWNIELRGKIYRTDAISLDFSRNGHMEFAFPQTNKLKYFDKLEELNLNNNSFTDISFLHELPRLKKLYLTDTNCTDFSPISELTELVELDLSYNTINDVSFMQSLQLLEKLIMYHCDIRKANLKEIGLHEKLWYLVFTVNVDLGEYSRWSPDYTFVENFPNLEAIYTEFTSPSVYSEADYSPLGKLNNLKILSTQGGQAPDCSDLKDLIVLGRYYADLSNLSLSHNIKAIYSQELYISGNTEDLSHLSNLELIVADITDENKEKIRKVAPNCQFHSSVFSYRSYFDDNMYDSSLTDIFSRFTYTVHKDRDELAFNIFCELYLPEHYFDSQS